MAPDGKASFEILEDSSGTAFAPDSVTPGQSVASVRSLAAFAYKNASGNAVLPSTSTTPQDPTAEAINVRPVPNEPATFVVAANSIDLANNKVMLGLMNAIGSGVVLRLRRAFVINSRITAATGVIADFRLRRITALTGGTAVTPRPHDTSDTLGSVTASHNSTATDAAGPIDLDRALWSSDEYEPDKADAENTDHALQTLIPMYESQPGTKPITIRPGEGIVVRNVTNTTAGTFDIVFVFTQESA